MILFEVGRFDPVAKCGVHLFVSPVGINHYKPDSEQKDGKTEPRVASQGGKKREG